jgi:hypothetical protein
MRRQTRNGQGLYKQSHGGEKLSYDEGLPQRQQISAQQKQYTTDFTVENFIKVIPDPDAFFSDPSRNLKLDAASSHYALVFLRNTFNRLPLRVIQSVFTKNSSQFSKTVEELKSLVAQKKFLMKSYRRPIPMPKNIHHIPLLQEVSHPTMSFCRTQMLCCRSRIIRTNKP